MKKRRLLLVFCILSAFLLTIDQSISGNWPYEDFTMKDVWSIDVKNLTDQEVGKFRALIDSKNIAKDRAMKITIDDNKIDFGIGRKLDEEEIVIREDEGVIREDEGVIGEDEGVIREDEGVIREDEGVIREDEGVIREDEWNDGVGNLKLDGSSYNKEMPHFDTELWKFSPDCIYSGFVGSCNPGIYIMPDNEVIKYVASIVHIEDGKLIWDECIFSSCGVLSGNYVTDDEQFNNPSYSDFWINPDYYFLNGLAGDCEDGAFAVASVLEAKGIKTKIVGGYATIEGNRVPDWVAEYKINDSYYRYYGGIPIEYDGDALGITAGFRKRNEGVKFEGVIMFGKNTYYENYRSDWNG